MIGFAFAAIFATIVRKLHGAYGFSEETLSRLRTFKHHGTIIAEGLEFHLFMTFLFPLSHGVAATMANMSGAEFILRLYH